MCYTNMKQVGMRQALGRAETRTHKFKNHQLSHTMITMTLTFLLVLSGLAASAITDIRHQINSNV